MIQNTERFELRFNTEALNNIDNWRASQPDIPSRAESIRRLTETGLFTTQVKSGKLSAGEKLIIHMLCDLSKHLEIKGGLDPEFIQAALIGGHYWGLEWEYSGIFPEHEDSEKNVTDVCDILDMWWIIESSYSKLSQQDKDFIEKECDHWGKHVTFRGFDGNNESEHLNIALFFIEDMKRYTHFDKRDLNSHCPLVENYQRMLTIFNPMRTKLVGRDLTADEIIKLLNAGSDSRK